MQKETDVAIIGGGAVPADFHWRTNPKQDQEELTDETLRALARAHHALPEPASSPVLPWG